ncbi:MAG: hypothetical protein IJ225_04765 [Solobacterium sp.]|nr:hypothetical protein [Solobacterium sp.]
MLDALLLDLGSVCRQLLPILGALALIYLCVLLKHLWKMIDQATELVKGLDPTVKSVNQSLEKVQAPLDTVVKYSHTLDDVHDRTLDSVQKISESAGESMDRVKDFVSEKLQSLDIYDDVRPADEAEVSAE